jgi:hypothetical protein
MQLKLLFGGILNRILPLFFIILANINDRHSGFFGYFSMRTFGVSTFAKKGY